MEAPHFGQQQGLHAGPCLGVLGIIGQVYLFWPWLLAGQADNLWVVVLREKLIWILPQIE